MAETPQASSESSEQAIHKSILKHTASGDDHRTSGVHFDEMNVLQTHHPPDKDYGHMKINEPPTPYSYENTSDSEEHETQLDPKQLALKMQNVTPEAHVDVQEESESSDDEELTPEQREIKKTFKQKRKKHYNEYDKVKLARELIAKELAELEEEEQNS